MQRVKREFSEDFKKEAVRLASRTDRPLARVAADLGVDPKTLRDWRARFGRFGGVSDLIAHDPVSELARLQRENEQLRNERDLLRRALATFAELSAPA
ncbi:MAG TPA: transposase [Thermoanaerobaculia bacterium]|nr:transposase [Thermoanaerobaculia bacterium]